MSILHWGCFFVAATVLSTRPESEITKEKKEKITETKEETITETKDSVAAGPPPWLAGLATGWNAVQSSSGYWKAMLNTAVKGVGLKWAREDEKKTETKLALKGAEVEAATEMEELLRQGFQGVGSQSQEGVMEDRDWMERAGELAKEAYAKAEAQEEIVATKTPLAEEKGRAAAEMERQAAELRRQEAQLRHEVDIASGLAATYRQQQQDKLALIFDNPSLNLDYQRRVGEQKEQWDVQSLTNGFKKRKKTDAELKAQWEGAQAKTKRLVARRDELQIELDTAPKKVRDAESALEEAKGEEAAAKEKESAAWEATRTRG